jgi:IS5 family transposase
MGAALKQTTFSTAGFDRYAKTTKRAAFLAEMDQVVPWAALCGLVEPFYPKGETGRRPFGVERMLRIYCLQQCWGGRPDGIKCVNIGSVTKPLKGPPKWSLNALRSIPQSMFSQSTASTNKTVLFCAGS